MFQQIYDSGQLRDILDSNNSVPRWVSDEAVVERIVQYAQQRADSRGEESAYDTDVTRCLITTNWFNFTEDWGDDGGDRNQVAIGQFDHDRSVGSNADLFTNTEIIQRGWLQTGDGRRRQAAYYEDTDFEGASVGDMWIPSTVQEYLCITELTGELLHGEPTIVDAM